MTQPTVGIIGLGAMGAGIAKTLRNNGFTIHVCDVRPGVADAFVAEGGTAHATTAALAAVSDVVVSVVVNAAQTEDVLFGNNGGSGAVAAAMKPGSVFVMCSTVDPNRSVALEARLEALGLLYLDAPISGGAARAASACAICEGDTVAIVLAVSMVVLSMSTIATRARSRSGSRSFSRSSAVL